tara:strand:+ start:1564 stop:1971 length:408 start_codon:yes stop_codon:yes gene_type:complete
MVVKNKTECNLSHDRLQNELTEIEHKLDTLEATLNRQEVELESWRDRSTRLPNWIRNGGVALFLAIFAQAMASVWWASEITNTQQNILSDVKVNTEYRIANGEKYNEIMIELTKLSVNQELIMTHLQNYLIDNNK